MTSFSPGRMLVGDEQTIFIYLFYKHASFVN